MPPTRDDAVHVHGVQEEYFYLMVHACACGGAWQSDSAEVEETGSRVLHRVAARCSRCGAEQTFCFQLDSHGGPKGPIRQVNPTGESSRALDVAEWMGLGRFYLGRIERLSDKVDRAQSLLDARQCLEEALKFYSADDDGPPASALWSDKSRRQADEQAEAFRRATLQAMLDRMPPMDRLRQADSLDQQAFRKAVKQRARERVGRKWWQFWRLLWRR
ncbi:MAG TPA: hypothetical protein VM431_01910 [Phycisphaerae bacterium]|nr:hypothetical protein [Phycisphaerae bacterium]